MSAPRIVPAKNVRWLARKIRFSIGTFPQPFPQALLIKIRSSGPHKSSCSLEGVVSNRQRRPKSATAGFNKTLPCVGAVDVAGVAEFEVFENLGVVMEMVGEVDVVVIPEGKGIEGTKLLRELEHAVVFFDNAGFAGGGRDQGPVVVTLFGENTEVIIDEQECIFMNLRMKTGEGFFQ